MANVKNFGLVGVADNVQYGKAGPKIKHTTGTFNFRNAADGADAALTAAGITSSAGNVTLTTGNVTLTTGNVVLSSNSGVVTLGDAGSLSRQNTGVYQLSGTGALIVPIGSTGQQPGTPTAGMFRYNTTNSAMEYYNTGWQTVSTAGASVASITGTANQITASSPTGAVTLSIPSTFIAPGSIASTSTITAATGLTVTAGGALVSAGGVTISALTANSFLYSGTAGLLTSTVAPTNGQLLIGSTGVAPVLGTIAGTAGNVTVTNGAGSITLNLDTVTQAASGNFVKVTLDSFGRVTGNTAVVTADITALVSATYVDVAGDTMTGNLNMGANYVTMTNAPVGDTDAANKAYVDAVAAGLTWKNAVSAASTFNLVLSGTQTVDGVALVATNRVLVKNQAAGAILAFDGLVAGSGYNVNATTNNVPLTGGTGTGATANITIAGGAVTVVTLVNPGTGYTDNDTLSATDASLGGRTGGAPFSIDVNGVSTNTGATNGIYVVAAGAWTRATDANSGTELDGAAVFVLAGTANDNTGWTQTVAPVTIGTTVQVWSQFSGSDTYTWGTGLVISGNTVSVNLGAGIVELPSDEIGIDLYDSANNPLILTTDGSTRVTTTGAKLGLLLDGSSLSKSTTGLRVAASGVNLASMVTGILPLANGGTNASLTATAGGVTYGTGTALAVTGAGTSGQVLTSAGAGTPTWSTLSGVAVTSFQTSLSGLTPSSATAGVVTLAGTLGAASGGTGATTLLDTGILIGNGTGVVETTSTFTYDTSDGTFILNAANFSTPGAIDIKAANGTGASNGGSVSLAAGSGIGTGSGGATTVRGGTGVVGVGGGLNLRGGASQAAAAGGNVSIEGGGTDTGTGGNVNIYGGVPNTSGTGGYISFSTAPTISMTERFRILANGAWSVGAAGTDTGTAGQVLTSAGSGAVPTWSGPNTASGDVKAFKQTVSLGANTTTNIGTVLPTGATILSVKVNVTVVNTTSTLSVGIGAGPSDYMTTAENDPQITGLYLAETMVVNSAVQIIATVAAQTGGVGSADVIVTYQIAN